MEKEVKLNPDNNALKSKQHSFKLLIQGLWWLVLVVAIGFGYWQQQNLTNTINVSNAKLDKLDVETKTYQNTVESLENLLQQYQQQLTAFEVKLAANTAKQAADLNLMQLVVIAENFYHLGNMPLAAKTLARLQSLIDVEAKPELNLILTESLQQLDRHIDAISLWQQLEKLRLELNQPSKLLVIPEYPMISLPTSTISGNDYLAKVKAWILQFIKVHKHHSKQSSQTLSQAWRIQQAQTYLNQLQSLLLSHQDCKALAITLNSYVKQNYHDLSLLQAINTITSKLTVDKTNIDFSKLLAKLKQ